MNTDIKINKPRPVAINKNQKTFQKETEVKPIIETLAAGETVLINEYYSDGILLLKEIHKYLRRKLPNKTLREQREYREAYHTFSNLILLEVKDQLLLVKKAPSIGWLEKFYPDNKHFALSFPEVQGLNSSWQWYHNGINIPVLRNKLRPYYGVYFPTRFEHLILFDNWLKYYDGPKKTAIDVGVGCGVLSLQMVLHGFQKVFATDTNPNAIVGLAEFMGTTKLSRKIELDVGHLFAAWKKETELIVFNPPWLPATRDVDGMDAAIYYDNTLFPEFFAEAKKRLSPDGKLVVIFSNLALITKVTTSHPIAIELAEGNRFQLEKRYTKKVSAASTKTKRDQHWRATEEVELWVLKHN